MKKSMMVKVLDGGFSTQMMIHVGDKVDGDPLWTARFLATDTDAVKKTHLDFLRAGSDIIETNTYQATITGFKKYLNLSSQESVELIKKAASLAQNACAEYKLEHPEAETQVFGSIGPYGAALHDGSEYTGSYADYTSNEEFMECHKPRLEALIESGITMFAIETIPCEKEALAIANLIKNYPEIKAWISFSCKDGKHLAHGEVFHQVATKVYLFNPQQIIAVGVNCLDPMYVTSLLKPINDGKEQNIPLVVYPNSGEKYIDETWTTGDEEVPHLASFVEEWINIGVKYIGGCCRTKAEDIKEIKEKIVKLSTLK